MRSNYFEAKRTRRATAFAFGAAMIFALLLFGLQGANPAHAASTFTVNSTGDAADANPGNGSCSTGVIFIPVGAECTLRAAIEEANALRGADTINFAIPGAGPHTISPADELPKIIKPLTIDGYTQGDSTVETADDAVENTIPLTEASTNAVLKIELEGSTAPTDYGLSIGTGVSNVVIKGLVINNFGQGIEIRGGTDGHKVEGNFIGTDPSGTTKEGNAYGLLFENTDGSTIGGTTPDKRNLISGNVFYGVWLTGGASGNKIHGNLIGPDKDGSSLGNGTIGVYLDFSAGNGNRILSNSIFSNGELGIDLNGDSVPTPNDDKDTDTGANRLQNHPLITSAQNELFGNTTNISGELNSTPSTRKMKRTFTIQFFSSPEKDPSGFGEGKTFLGEIQVKTNRQGKAPIFFSTQAASEGEYITATATNKRTGDTSEFSNAQIVEDPVIEPQ